MQSELLRANTVDRPIPRAPAFTGGGLFARRDKSQAREVTDKTPCQRQPASGGERNRNFAIKSMTGLVFHYILKSLQDTASHSIRTYGNCPVYEPGAAGAEIARHHQDYALHSTRCPRATRSVGATELHEHVCGDGARGARARRARTPAREGVSLMPTKQLRSPTKKHRATSPVAAAVKALRAFIDRPLKPGKLVSLFDRLAAEGCELRIYRTRLPSSRTRLRGNKRSRPSALVFATARQRRCPRK